MRRLIQELSELPRLIVISAPSGAGKTTLCRRLLRDFPGEIVLSISSTTREPRGKEANGVDYFFLTKEEFQRGIDAGEFAEWALVHGNYYGTSKKVIEQAFAKKQSVLLDIDVQGAQSLKNSYPKEAYRIFISPPSLAELEARLRSRGTDNEQTIQKRLKNAKYEMTHLENFDSAIVNDDLDRAYGELRGLVEKALVEKTLHENTPSRTHPEVDQGPGRKAKPGQGSGTH
jgi:guanylate kinase